MRRRLDKNLHRFRPWTQGQINDLGFPEPESSDLSARASPPKFLIPTLRKPRRVGQPQLGGAKGGPARLQNVGGVPFVGLLFAYITGPDLRCISDPDLVPQILDQLNEPLTVARSFHADQHRCSQLLRTAWPRPWHALASARPFLPSPHLTK